MSEIAMIQRKLNIIEKLLQEIIAEQKRAASSKEDQLMSVEEVCEYLKLKRSYLYKLTMNGEIPHSKPLGKKIYFSKDKIDAWVKQNKLDD